jgi:ABC-type transport system involved in multi-copper enzyme maturation permease subunit
MIVILLTGFPKMELLAGPDGQLNATIALLLLYGTASAGFTYCISFFISTPTMAAICIFIGGFLLGLILPTIGVFLRLIGSTKEAYMNGIRYIFALIPFFALGEGLYNLSFTNVFQILELEGSQKYDPLDWKITGMNIAFLAWETFFYFFAAVLYEYLSGIPSFRALFCNKAPPAVDNSVKDDGKSYSVHFVWNSQ